MDDGNDLDVFDVVIYFVKIEKFCFILIEVKMVIGYGSFGKVGKLVVYGFLFGEKEFKFVKEVYDW